MYFATSFSLFSCFVSIYRLKISHWFNFLAKSCLFGKQEEIKDGTKR